jgi:hypothetical protein
MGGVGLEWERAAKESVFARLRSLITAGIIQIPQEDNLNIMVRGAGKFT